MKEGPGQAHRLVSGTIGELLLSYITAESVSFLGLKLPARLVGGCRRLGKTDFHASWRVPESAWNHTKLWQCRGKKTGETALACKMLDSTCSTRSQDRHIKVRPNKCHNLRLIWQSGASTSKTGVLRACFQASIVSPVAPIPHYAGYENVPSLRPAILQEFCQISRRLSDATTRVNIGFEHSRIIFMGHELRTLRPRGSMVLGLSVMSTAETNDTCTHLPVLNTVFILNLYL